MNKELEMLDNLSKQEIIVKKCIGIYMDGSVQTMPHKTTVGIEFKGVIETIKQTLIKAQENEDWNTIIEEYDIKPHEVREAFIVYKMMQGAGYKVAHIEKAQKQEKILNIIKEKLVNIVDLWQCTDLYTYNSLVKGTTANGISRELTQEEFNMLKEWLKQDRSE